MTEREDCRFCLTSQLISRRQQKKHQAELQAIQQVFDHKCKVQALL